MNDAVTKKCKDCGVTYPVNREYFGQHKRILKNGDVSIGFRNSCRKCQAANTALHTAENPQLAAERYKRRQELKQNATGSHTKRDIDVIRIKLKNACRYCGCNLAGDEHIDHITPLSRGGSDYPRNLTLACHSCNQEKTNKTLDEYLTWRKERGLKVRRISLTYESPDEPSVSAGRKRY